MEVLISVVMSTYNTKRDYLVEAINSILFQTYSNFEFIIVCDGSIEEYNYIKSTFNDPRIKLILHEENRGLPVSLNEGIRLSKGKYIARMDSDDIAINNRLQNQMEYMECHPQIEISGMYAKCFGKVNKNSRNFFSNPREIEIQMLYLPVLMHPTVMFRKSFFDKGMFYNENFLCAQDMELWTRAVNDHNIAVIRKYGLNYRIHDNQAGIAKRKLQEYYVSLIREEATRKLNGLSKDEIYYVLEILNGIRPLSECDIDVFYKKIDAIINNSEAFDKKAMKKVFYNRVFCLIIRYSIKINIFNPEYMIKILNPTNVIFVIWKIMGEVI